MARREPPQHLLGQLQRLREDIQGRNRRIVGMKEARIVHKTVNPVVGDLTQTLTFGEGDWDIIKADAARIELVNNTGDSRIITDCVVRAKPVIKLSGNFGLVHDGHEDFEDIVKNGERRFEFGNDVVVTRDQLEQLADYYWKYNKTPKHVFVISLPGTCYWYQPGGWYRLDIGAAGESENIDSLCECMYVRTSRRTGENGTTMIGFREVEEAFKHDSNAVARFLAGGPIEILVESNDTVVVGGQYFTGKANSYCSGTNDDVEIQNAIDVLSERGGGTVYLPQGTYSLAATLVPKAGVTLRGAGIDATILDITIDDEAIYTNVATVGFGIRDMTITTSDATPTANLIRFSNVDDIVLVNLKLTDSGSHAINVGDCENLSIVTVLIDSCNGGITANASGGTITNYVITNSTLTGVNNHCLTLVGSDITCTNGYIKTVTASAAGDQEIVVLSASGSIINGLTILTADKDHATFILSALYITAARSQVTNVTISDIDNTTAANAYGVYLPFTAGSCSFGSLIVYDVSGTGVLLDNSADNCSFGSGRTYSNGTDYTDNAAGTTTGAFQTS